MNNKYKKIFTPVKVGRLILKNRIFCAPASLNWIAEDGSLTPQAIAFYENTAKGGAAVITYGEVIVHSATGKSHDRQICIDDPQRLVDFANLARAIRRHGAAASAELSHGGKFGGLVSLAGGLKEGRTAYGASYEMTPDGEVQEMPKELLLEVIDSFGKGAAVLKRAGFDMCMVHAGHGWLFSQFLSTKTNHRTDEFGGSFENRARPLVMALEAIRKQAGPDFPIEVRISGDEFIEGGITLEDAKRLSRLIEDKCDMINVSAGIHEGPELFIRTHPTSYLPKGANAYLAAEIKKEVSIPVSTVGGLGDPDLMAEILEKGEADIIELRRPLLADPEFPKKLMEGREDEIIPCLRCNGCFGESLKTNMTTCAVNPTAGNELNDWITRVQPVKTKKKVMVAGAGPGGLQAALTAKERGHEVVLYEKAEELGGTLNIFKHCEFKYGLYEFAQVMERLVERAGVEIRRGTEVTAEIVRAEKPDVLLLASGSVPIVPPIPGVKGENVILAAQAYGHTDRVGGNVVIIGGGMVGCETAAYLGRSGKKVTLVEMREAIAMDADVFGQAAVTVDMRKSGVCVKTSAAAKEITREGLLISKADEETELIKADTVIIAAGYRPDSSLYLELAQETPAVHMIGDCRKQGKVMNAVSDGYYLALDI